MSRESIESEGEAEAVRHWLRMHPPMPREEHAFSKERRDNGRSSSAPVFVAARPDSATDATSLLATLVRSAKS